MLNTICRKRSDPTEFESTIAETVAEHKLNNWDDNYAMISSTKADDDNSNATSHLTNGPINVTEPSAGNLLATPAAGFVKHADGSISKAAADQTAANMLAAKDASDQPMIDELFQTEEAKSKGIPKGQLIKQKEKNELQQAEHEIST